MTVFVCPKCAHSVEADAGVANWLVFCWCEQPPVPMQPQSAKEELSVKEEKEE